MGCFRSEVEPQSVAPIPSAGRMRCLLKGADDGPHPSARTHTLARYKIIDVSPSLQSNYTAAHSAGCFLVYSSQ